MSEFTPSNYIRCEKALESGAPYCTGCGGHEHLCEAPRCPECSSRRGHQADCSELDEFFGGPYIPLENVTTMPVTDKKVDF